jgi:tetratricopeptide (TPR) repeat protein
MPGIRAVLVSAAVAAILAGGRADAQVVIRLTGSIKDMAGRPIRGAVITAENPDQAPPRMESTSNDKGQFAFLGIRRGSWTFTVQAPGYELVQFSRPVGPGPRQDPLDLRLTRTAGPAALPMDNVKAADIQQRIDRAESLASSGDLDGAIAAWRELLAKAPALTTVYLRLGALYERKPDRERALETYRQLLQIEPANDKARAAVERLSAKS